MKHKPYELAATSVKRHFFRPEHCLDTTLTPTSVNKSKKYFNRKLKEKGKVHNTLAWLGICLVMISAVWLFTFLKLDREASQTAKDALKDAFYLSQSYAEQLDRSIAHVDHVNSQLRYVWIKTGGALDLERQLEEGLLPLMPTMQAWIADRHGRIITSTSRQNVGRYIANHHYFDALQSGRVQDLYISDPLTGQQETEPVIHFARKLTAPDGSFAGVVVVGVTPSYLESFTSELTLGKNDSVTLKKTNGTLLASKRGDNIRSLPTIYRTPSIFGNSNGVERIPAAKFVDGVPRIVAWHKLKNYPLMSMVNESEPDVFANHLQMERDYKAFAAVSSAILFALALIGINYSNRLSHKRKLEEEIKQTYRVATEAAREGFLTIKPIYSSDRYIVDFVIEDCNDRGALFIGLDRQTAIGTKLSALHDKYRPQQALNVCVKAMQSGFYEDEIKVDEGDTHEPVWVNRRIMKSADGLAVTLRDISEAKAYQLELTRLANTDSLTSLPNRHWMMDYLPMALEHAKKNNSSLAILFIDLDDFKIINDTQGHAAGDELLRAVALRLKSVVRGSDSIVRIGGDEFMIIAEDYDSGMDLTPLAERLVAALTEPFPSKNGQFYSVGASIGISIYQEDGLDCESLIKHADIAMYAAKNKGKNQYQYYRPYLSDSLFNRIDAGKAVEQAINNDEFVLLYQPRVNARDSKLCGMEALLRWDRPGRGMILPSEFIPIAEETGVIIDLGNLVIKKVCSQIAQWKADNIPVIPVSINVSAQQLNRGTLKHVLEGHLTAFGIDASLLEIEITESCMIDYTHTVPEEVSAIKAMGIKVSIDDFGTGYSSMSQLQNLDFDILKIDKSFTHALSTGKEGEAFFKAMISMAHALGMKVVAEGVETESQLYKLQELACDDIQGYYISRPIAARMVPELLHRQYVFPHQYSQALSV